MFLAIDLHTARGCKVVRLGGDQVIVFKLTGDNDDSDSDSSHAS